MCLAKCVKKYEKYSVLPLRLALGLVFIFHGYGKIAGGVDGFAGMLSVFGGAAIVLAWLVALTELLGGIAVLVGVATRYAAALISLVMIGAIILVHAKNGYALGNGGVEFVLTLLLIAISLVITGGGKVLNFDKKLFGKEL